MGRNIMRLINSSVWSIIGSLSEKILTLLTYIIVARSVLPNDLGLFVSVFIIIELIISLGGFGIIDIIVKTKDLDNKKLSKIKFFSLILSISVFLFILIIIIPALFLIDNQGLIFITLAMSVYPAIFCYSSFYVGILQRKFDYKKIAIRKTISSLFYGITGITLALSEFGIWSLVIGRYVLVFTDLYLLKKLNSDIDNVCVLWDKKEIVGLFSFGWKVSLAELFTFTTGRVYEIVVVSFFGPASIAILDVGRKVLSNASKLILTPLSPVSLSYFASSEEPLNSYNDLSKKISILLIPLYILLFYFSDLIIQLIFGDKWSQSSDFLKYTAAAAILQPMAWFVPKLYINMDKANILLKVNIYNFIFVVSLTFILIVITNSEFSFMPLIMFITILSSSVLKLSQMCYYLNFPVKTLFASIVRNISLFLLLYLYLEVINVHVIYVKQYSEIIRLFSSVTILLLTYYSIVIYINRDLLLVLSRKRHKRKEI
jgi:teichuronic acid exporter